MYTSTDPASPFLGYFAENDQAKIYYHADIGPSFAWKHIFIDTDQNATTGFAIGGVGAACGAVVEPGDPIALAAALMRVRALDPARSAAAARTAAEPFTYERQVAEFERIYRRLPESRAGFSLRNR